MNLQTVNGWVGVEARNELVVSTVAVFSGLTRRLAAPPEGYLAEMELQGAKEELDVRVRVRVRVRVKGEGEGLGFRMRVSGYG